MLSTVIETILRGLIFVKRYLLDEVLLSACRLLTFVWILLLVRDLLLRFHPFDIGSDLVPPFGDDTVHALAFAALWTVLIFGADFIAEHNLDKERHAHAYAHYVKLPNALEQLEAVTAERDTSNLQLATYQSHLQRLEAKYTTLEVNHGAALGEILTLKDYLRTCKGELSHTVQSLGETKADLLQTREALAQSKQETKVAEARVLARLKPQLDQAAATLVEYQSQITTQLRAAGQLEGSGSNSNQLAKTSDEGIKVSAQSPQQQIVTVANPIPQSVAVKKNPRKNYT